MKSLIAIIFLLISSVYGQNIVVRTTPIFTTTLLSIDTLTSEEIKTLKLKSNLVYIDSTLDMETHYDLNGNKIYQKCYNGHLCHLDSFFYSNKIELCKSYDENNKLINWYKISKSGNTTVEEYYNKEYNSDKFKQAYRRELKFKNNKVVFRKYINEGKLQSIEHIKYNTKGIFIERQETHYDYKKDSLVNITTIISKNGKTEMTHTNPKYKHYSLDTTSKKSEFDYTDYNKDYVQAYDNHRVIANIAFDNKGNIKQSDNFVRLDELLIKAIYRIYDVKNKTYTEKIDLIEYYNNGLIKKSEYFKSNHKYEYY